MIIRYCAKACKEPMIENNSTKGNGETGPNPKDRSDRLPNDAYPSYRGIFDSASDGIFILDATSGHITDANPFLCELLGFPRDEVVGKPLGEISVFKDVLSHQEIVGHVQKSGRIYYENLRLKTKSGREVVVELVGHIFKAIDSDAIHCNLRDITVRKLAADEVRNLATTLEQQVKARTVQLEAANEELEAFSYSVSHDLRAPLRHIQGFVSLLEQDLGPSLSEKNAGRLANVSQAAQRMGSLIDDLLSLSHTTCSEIKLSEVDLNELVRETLALFKTETNQHRGSWEIHFLPMVHADRNLMRVVLMNLMSNAVKFSSKRRDAKIEINCVRNPDNEETVIFVRDNGAGFDPQNAQHLFGVFQRLHPQEEFEGTGIGLANVRRIIRRHGGRTWAEGVPDVGATFYFSLPGPTSKATRVASP
jgi:PAS domain S-box-containing protein